MIRWFLAWLRRDREGDYVQQIQCLKPDTLLMLPSVKPLKAVKEPRFGLRRVG